ncbi:MAG: hypothetical protein FWH32_03480 [Clostridiales bacterium]|nr:hypothetical protein [Clostridiales bacterium]
MQGLRKPEDEKFENFVRLIQEEAAKKDAIFFVDCEEGHEKLLGDLDMSDLSGWLIPKGSESEFEPKWKKASLIDDLPRKWDGFYRFAEWTEDSEGQIAIEFVDYRGWMSE